MQILNNDFCEKTVDPTSSTNFTTHLVVIHATVVQTECEANIHGAVRGPINRSVTTCVSGFQYVTYLTFLLYREHYQQILTLVANRYLFHYNDNSHQRASVIEESSRIFKVIFK